MTDHVAFVDVDVVADTDGRAVADVEGLCAHQDEGQDDDQDDVGHRRLCHLEAVQVVQQLPHSFPDQRVRTDRDEDEEPRAEEEGQLK